MSLIARIVLLVLAIPFVLADGGDGCGSGQFKYVPSVDVGSDVLTRVLGGPLRICVSKKEGHPIPPTHPPTLTAPTTGRGTVELAAVLLTSHRVPSLLLSVAVAGIGPPVPTAAIVPQPLPPPSSPPLHQMPPMVAAIMGTPATVTATNALTLRSATTAPAMLLLVLRAALLALLPAWSAVITSALTPSSTSTTVVVVPFSVRARTATPSLAFGTLAASVVSVKVSHPLFYPWLRTNLTPRETSLYLCRRLHSFQRRKVLCRCLNLPVDCSSVNDLIPHRPLDRKSVV